MVSKESILIYTWISINCSMVEENMSMANINYTLYHEFDISHYNKLWYSEENSLVVLDFTITEFFCIFISDGIIWYYLIWPSVHWWPSHSIINKITVATNSTCWCTCTGDTAPGVEGGGDVIPDPADIWW